MHFNIPFNIICRLVLVLSFLMYPDPVFCQKDFYEGYIITNESDTLNGHIKDRKSEPFGELYKKIRFKDKGLFAKKLGPGQINGYYNGRDQYESLWLDTRRNFLREYYFSIPGSGERQFLKVVSKGYLTYYHLEYVDPESFYFDYIPLYKRENETDLVRVSQGIFGLRKKLLAEYFNDCPELAGMITDGELKDNQAVADFYNLFIFNINR